jgi:HD-like signal output (HDOD) protein
MQNETTRTEAGEDDRIDAAIIGLLLDSATSWPWSVEELTRELGDKLAVEDGLTSLYAAGLIHRSGELVFPTRAAIRSHQIIR